jgi:hypothetical protein
MSSAGQALARMFRRALDQLLRARNRRAIRRYGERTERQHRGQLHVTVTCSTSRTSCCAISRFSALPIAVEGGARNAHAKPVGGTMILVAVRPTVVARGVLLATAPSMSTCSSMQTGRNAAGIAQLARIASTASPIVDRSAAAESSIVRVLVRVRKRLEITRIQSYSILTNNDLVPGRGLEPRS